MIAEIVYALCSLTSGACAILLGRMAMQTKQRLLIWSSLGFAGLFLNNILLFVDEIVLPNVDLSVVRIVPAALGLMVLCFGLIWDAER